MDLLYFLRLVLLIIECCHSVLCSRHYTQFCDWLIDFELAFDFIIIHSVTAL